jgi:hypothetical protein
MENEIILELKQEKENLDEELKMLAKVQKTNKDTDLNIELLRKRILKMFT